MNPYGFKLMETTDAAFCRNHGYGEVISLEKIRRRR